MLTIRPRGYIGAANAVGLRWREVRADGIVINDSSGDGSYRVGEDDGGEDAGVGIGVGVFGCW